MKCLILLAVIFKWILKITSLPKIKLNIFLLLIEERENFFAPIKPFLLYAFGEKMLWLPKKRVKAQAQVDSSSYGLWV